MFIVLMDLRRMEFQAQDFRQQGTKMKRKLWIENMKIKLIVFGIIIALILLIFLSICHGFQCFWVPTAASPFYMNISFTTYTYCCFTWFSIFYNKWGFYSFTLITRNLGLTLYVLSCYMSWNSDVKFKIYSFTACHGRSIVCCLHWSRIRNHTCNNLAEMSSFGIGWFPFTLKQPL